MVEKILLVVVSFKRRGQRCAQDIAQECRELVHACAGQVQDTVICRIEVPTPEFLIGKGKVEEIKDVCNYIDVDSIIFSHELKGNQQRNLEKMLERKVIDRTQLILDIFARRAKSQEGRMQVELAQLEYMLPRLVGKGIAMSRLGGGIGTLGPGETKLETDRRRINQRITKLKHELKNVSLARKLKRKKRKEQQIPLISLVGYTNAGKSTLLNALTQAGREVKNGLFTTLDPLSRQYTLANKQKVVFSDTVGFLRDLPHGLIEAFHATLEEVVEADLLVHVVDISNQNFRDCHQSVLDVLKEIGAHEKNVITAFNKIDCVEHKKELAMLINNYENAVLICAKTGEYVDLLLEKISGLVYPSFIEIHVEIPISRMDLVNLLHQQGCVHKIEYLQNFVKVFAAVPEHLAGKFR